MIDQIVSHYKIVAEIGAGGMGVVYKALDTRLDRYVAIKFLPPQLKSNAVAKTRFVHEAKAASALQHSNIAVIHEIDETPDGQTFIVMDYYEGETLQEKISRGPVSLEEAVKIVSQIAAGLATAHEKGILHRDIKPSNILLTTDGDAKLVDFGLAKLVGQTRLTKPGTTLGTVAYMSPEQATGADIDHRSDIFSLGVVLYELLTADVPFKGDHEAAIMFGIVHNDPSPIANYRSDVPEELEQVIRTAMQKEAGDRYESASDMSSGLTQFGGSPPPRPTRAQWVLDAALIGVTAALVIIASYLAYDRLRPSTPPSSSMREAMIVVLPFENLGPANDDYFADGITEEITSRLAGVSKLGVIARTSAVLYKGAGKSIVQIGEELGVDYILEGTVRWDQTGTGGPRVRITPQLIQVVDATHVWSQRYDRVITDVLGIQSEIAEKVTTQLGIALLEPEREALADQQTESSEAYRAYLRGIVFKEQDDTQLAIEMFSRAIELDANFATAYAELSALHSGEYHFGTDTTPERLAMAKTAVDRALELQPDLPEAYLALGYYYYWGHRAYDQAVKALARAESSRPNDPNILRVTGSIQRRRGEFHDAILRFERCLELSPRDGSLAWEVGSTYRIVRDYAAAETFLKLAISLAPDGCRYYLWHAWNYQAWPEHLESARRTIESTPDLRLCAGTYTHVYFSQCLYEKDYEEALRFASSISQPVLWWQAKVMPRGVLMGWCYELMGETDLAQSAFDTAREALEAELVTRPDDHRLHSALGIAYAGLGRKEDAIEQGRRGVELFPTSKDALIGPWRLWQLAIILTMLGEDDAALDELERIASVATEFSGQSFELDPRWRSLREHPRFQALLDVYAAGSF